MYIICISVDIWILVLTDFEWPTPDYCDCNIRTTPTTDKVIVGVEALEIIITYFVPMFWILWMNDRVSKYCDERREQVHWSCSLCTVCTVCTVCLCSRVRRALDAHYCWRLHVPLILRHRHDHQCDPSVR